MITLYEYTIESVARQLSLEEALNIPKGSVIAVRSPYKHSFYHDHLSLIVGGKIKKERGIRPNLITLPQIVSNISSLLDNYKPIDGIILLLLKTEDAARVLDNAHIHLSEGELI